MLAFYLLLVGLAGTFASPVLLDEQSIEERIEEGIEEKFEEGIEERIEEGIEEKFEEGIEERIEEGIEERIEDRIVGGRNGRIEEVPWQAHLMFDGRFSCGGTIISQFWVLSAAHCTERATSRYSVRVGTSFLNSGGTIHAVWLIMNHPQYGRPRALSNDISLIQVRTAFRWTNQVRAATLPTANQAINGGTWTRISGWGATRSGGPLPTTLQIADVPIVSQAACRSAYGTSAITNDMLCAGFTQGGVDTCQGDSGGPLAVNGRVFGVTSWGRGCGSPGFPGVYARVPFFRNWIRQTTGV